MSKSKLTNSWRTIVTSFLVLVSGTAEYRQRKIHNLGQSRHFAFRREHDKEATLVVVVMILSAYYVMAQRYDVILQVSQIEICNFAEKREKKLEKIYYTPFTTVYSFILSTIIPTPDLSFNGKANFVVYIVMFNLFAYIL